MAEGSKLVSVLATAAALAGTGAPHAAAAPRYGEVHDAADLDRVFAGIRADVARAQSRAELTRLERRAGYLVTLTYSRPWRVRFGVALLGLRQEARRQFGATADAVNRRAAEIGTRADYAQTWGGR